MNVYNAILLGIVQCKWYVIRIVAHRKLIDGSSQGLTIGCWGNSEKNMSCIYSIELRAIQLNDRG